MNAIIEPRALQIAAQGTDERQELISVLQSSLYPGAKEQSVELVLSYCRVNGIDPMLKPVHIVPTNIKVGPDRWEMRDVLMPGIADYRIKAARSNAYGGKSEPIFGPERTETIGGAQVTFPEWCRITISRLVQGQAREFTAVERWLENFAAVRKTGAPNEMWQKRAYGQLAKCAEAQALRMAFPEFSGGQPTAEEMEGKTIDGFNGPTLEAKPEPPPPATEPQAAPERQTLRQVVARLVVEMQQAQSIGGLADIEARDEMQKVLARGPGSDAAAAVLKARDAARERLAVLVDGDGWPGPETGEITPADRLASG